MSNLEQKDKELEESEKVLKDMVEQLNNLPTDVLEQLANNLDEIEKQNDEDAEK